MLFGDMPPEQWRPQGDETTTVDPWPSFQRALASLAADDVGQASDEWRRITEMDGIESRHVLQAWHFLREVGIQPPSDVSTEVLGVVAEVAVAGGHDCLAAYRDGSVRYLNFSGTVLVIEPGTATGRVGETVGQWLDIGQIVARAVGVWDQPHVPVLRTRETRITMLTPGGLRFGQGLDTALRQDRAAAAFLAAATQVLTTVTEVATTR